MPEFAARSLFLQFARTRTGLGLSSKAQATILACLTLEQNKETTTRARKTRAHIMPEPSSFVESLIRFQARVPEETCFNHNKNLELKACQRDKARAQYLHIIAN